MPIHRDAEDTIGAWLIDRIVVDALKFFCRLSPFVNFSSNEEHDAYADDDDKLCCKKLPMYMYTWPITFWWLLKYSYAAEVDATIQRVFSKNNYQEQKSFRFHLRVSSIIPRLSIQTGSLRFWFLYFKLPNFHGQQVVNTFLGCATMMLVQAPLAMSLLKCKWNGVTSTLNDTSFLLQLLRRRKGSILFQDRQRCNMVTPCKQLFSSLLGFHLSGSFCLTII